MPRRPAASFSSSSLSVSSSVTSSNTPSSFSRSLNNVYIKGLPSNCTEDGLIEWATATVTHPASAKTIKDYSGVTQRSNEYNDEMDVPCSGVGFVKFYTHEDALAFIDIVKGEKGMQACLAKETMQGQMERASDPSSTNLYISHLPLHFTEQDILSLFPPPTYLIASIRLLKTGDQPGRRSRDPNPQFKGAAFARFETREMAMRAIAEYNGKHLLNQHDNGTGGGKKMTLQLRFADSEGQKMLKKQERYASNAVQLQQGCLTQPYQRIDVVTNAIEQGTERHQKKLEIEYGQADYSKTTSPSSGESSPIMHLGPFPVTTFAPPPPSSFPQPAATYAAPSIGGSLPSVPYNTLPPPIVDRFDAIPPPTTTFPSFSSPSLPPLQTWLPQPKQAYYGDSFTASLSHASTMGYPPTNLLPLPAASYPDISANASYSSSSNNSFTSAIPNAILLPDPAASAQIAEPIPSILSSAAAAEKAAQAATYLQQYLGSLGYTKDALLNLPPLLSLPGLSTSFTNSAASLPPMPAFKPPLPLATTSSSARPSLPAIFPSLGTYPNYPPSDSTRDTFKFENSYQSLQASPLEVENARNAELQQKIQALQIQHENLIEQTRSLQAKMTANTNTQLTQEQNGSGEMSQRRQSVSPSVALNAYRFGNSWQDPMLNVESVDEQETADTSPLSTPIRTRSMTTHHMTTKPSMSLLPPASALARRSSAFEARDSKALQEQQQKSIVEERRGSASSETYGTERRASTSIYIPPHARERESSPVFTTPASSARGSLSSDTHFTRRGSLGTAYSTPASMVDTSVASFFERRKSLSPEVPLSANAPPPGLEHIVPKEKIILPFDKALRSFSTAGLETYASKAASATISGMPSLEAEVEEDKKTMDLVKDFFSRRGSQQVPLVSSEIRTMPNRQASSSTNNTHTINNSNTNSTNPKRAGITRRNSSFLRLKSSFESVKELNESSPSPLSKVWPGDSHLQATGATPGNNSGSNQPQLTQITPHFTFGVSHAPIDKERLTPSNVMAAHTDVRGQSAELDTLLTPLVRPGLQERIKSDASEDVVEQYMESKAAGPKAGLRNWQ